MGRNLGLNKDLKKIRGGFPECKECGNAFPALGPVRNLGVFGLAQILGTRRCVSVLKKNGALGHCAQATGCGRPATTGNSTVSRSSSVCALRSSSAWLRNPDAASAHKFTHWPTGWHPACMLQVSQRCQHTSANLHSQCSRMPTDHYGIPADAQ